MTALLNQYLMLHRHWRINNLRIQRANNNILIILHRLFGIEKYVFQLGNWKTRGGAHSSAILAAIQYSETLLQSKDDEVPDYEGKDEEDGYSCLQNPTKTPIIS
jgi:hypothetical protein